MRIEQTHPLGGVFAIHTKILQKIKESLVAVYFFGALDLFQKHCKSSECTFCVFDMFLSFGMPFSRLFRASQRCSSPIIAMSVI